MHSRASARSHHGLIRRRLRGLLRLQTAWSVQIGGDLQVSTGTNIAATDRSHRRNGLLPKWWSGAFFPSSPRRGGCAIRETSRSILSSRRRGGVQPQQNSVAFDHHPVRSIKEASRYFEMSRPPLLGEEGKIADLCFWATTPEARDYIAAAARPRPAAAV